MLKVGIQSGCLFTQNDLETAMQIVKTAGFDSIDYNIDNRLDYEKVCAGEPCAFFRQSDDELRAYFAPHKAAIEKYGLPYHQMHAPFPVYAPGNDAANDELLNSVVKSLMLCGYLDCPYLVVHPIKITRDPTGETEWKTNIEFYTKLIPYAKQYGVKVCLENMFFTRIRVTESTCADMREAAAYIDTLNGIAGEELFAFCLDLGHAMMIGKNIRRSINTLGHRLQALHLHENDGREDLHMHPFAYRRTTDYLADWDGLLDGLCDIGYRGVLSFETSSALRTLPPELRPSMARYIAAVGKYFAQQIEERNAKKRC